MPHVSVKLFAGRDEKTKLALAEAIRDSVSHILGGGIEHISVSVEDFTLDTWGTVYDQEIRDNPKLLIRPDYDWDSEYLRLTGSSRCALTVE